jgi:hypothetical protein
MVDILTAMLTQGLPAVDAACAEAIATGVHSAPHRPQHPRPPTRSRPACHDLPPAALTLRHAPIADCARYDKVCAMKAAFDEIMATAFKTPARTSAPRRGSAQRRDHREASAFNQVPAQYRQVTLSVAPGLGSTRVVRFLPVSGGESMNRTTWLQDRRMQKFWYVLSGEQDLLDVLVEQEGRASSFDGCSMCSLRAACLAASIPIAAAIISSPRRGR